MSAKPRIRLRLVPQQRPLGPLTRAEKLAKAIAFLRTRGRYVLDAGSPKPRWGKAHEVPAAPNAAMLAREMNADRRRTR